MSNNSFFRFYFNFISIPTVGRIEISEPVGFDSESFKVEQDKGRFAKDVFSSNEDSTLTIYKGHFQYINPYEINPYGTVYEHASMGFDYFYYLDTHFGTESKVEFIFEKDGEETVSIVDFKTIVIKDGEISFKTLIDNSRKLINQKKDTSINAFNNSDLYGNNITPCPTYNVLVKAHPLTQKSRWSSVSYNQRHAAETASPLARLTIFINNCQSVLESGIEDTLSFFEQTNVKFITNTNEDADDFNFVRAKYNLTNGILRIRNLSFKQKTGQNGGGDGYLQTKFKIIWGYDINNPIGSQDIFDFQIQEDEEFNFNQSLIEVNISYIPAGARLWVFFRSNLVESSDIQINPNQRIFVDTTISEWDMEFSVTSTAIDSVAKGSRYIDVVRHNVKSIKSGVTVESSLYGENGVHYNNFCFNGNMLGKKTDSPFNNKLEDLLNVTKERNCDYIIKENSIVIEHYDYFYKNIELATFEDVNSENEITNNDRYLLKGFNFGYEKSSFDRNGNDVNTNDDVHTHSEWIMPTKEHNNIFEVKLKHIRSQKLIEEQRKKSVLEKKAQENDESLFVIKCETLPANSRGGFTALLKYSGSRIISNGSFSWDTLGFNIGDIILVNNQPYQVDDIQGTILLISGNLGLGEAPITFDYPLTNVNLVVSTNQGYLSITGIDNVNTYANLDYSIKRNIIDFYPILGTACENLLGKKITNTLFRINGELETLKIGETTHVKDNKYINVNEAYTTRKITKKVHNISVNCDYLKAKQLIRDIEDNNGYISFVSINGRKVKGFPIKLDYVWHTEELDMELEEKAEVTFMTIDKVLNEIIVKENGYEQKTGLNYYEIFNNFVNLYNENEVRLNENIISFEFIRINGVAYTNIVDFTNALENILR